MIDSEAHWRTTADFTTSNRMWTFCWLSITCKYLWISDPQDLDMCPFKSLERVEFSLTKKPWVPPLCLLLPQNKLISYKANRYLSIMNSNHYRLLFIISRVKIMEIANSSISCKKVEFTRTKWKLLLQSTTALNWKLNGYKPGREVSTSLSRPICCHSSYKLIDWITLKYSWNHSHDGSWWNPHFFSWHKHRRRYTKVYLRSDNLFMFPR